VVLRCVLDGLLLPAGWRAGVSLLEVFDGEESFLLEPLEAVYYELVAASDEEQLLIRHRYRLLRTAGDFCRIAA
jgi:hypothetical protein